MSAPVTGRATNNVAELQAATVAVQVAAGCGMQYIYQAYFSFFFKLWLSLCYPYHLLHRYYKTMYNN